VNGIEITAPAEVLGQFFMIEPIDGAAALQRFDHKAGRLLEHVSDIAVDVVTTGHCSGERCPELFPRQARALGEGQRPEQIEGRPFTDALGLVEFCEEVVERFAESVWKSQVNQIASVGGDCSLQQGIANDRAIRKTLPD
jgi:hypothetical protein